MIYESYPWKQDLLRRKKLFIAYNTYENFQKNDERTFTVLEKAIFYSAFIIRKLIDCRDKTSDEADKYTIEVEKRIPLQSINLMNRWPDENMCNWNQLQKENVNGKDICNWLIHSYIFFFSQNANEMVDGFFVSSDYDRNKAIYFVDINDWLDYMDFIGNDDICCIKMRYDEKKRDFRIILKSNIDGEEGDDIVVEQ